MSASEPTFPGAFPATPAGASNEPDAFIEVARSYALDLSGKTKPYLPEAVAKHMPEHEIKYETNLAKGSHDENARRSNQGEGESSRGQQLERTISPSDVQVDQAGDENADQSDKVIPVDLDAQSCPKDDVAREQEQETSPSIFISNRHLSGSESNRWPAAHNDVEPGTSESSAVSEGVAEDQLLADYLGPHEPTVSTENAGNSEEMSTPNGPTSPAQFEPRVRDFAVEEEVARMSINAGESDTATKGEPTVLIDSINEPYKPHRLENIQEKTRDNRLPPLESPSASTPPSPDASYRTGSGSVLGKLIRGRRSSSAASKDDPTELRRRSTSTPSYGGSEQNIDRPLQGIQEGSVDSSEQAKREDLSDSPQSQKVGLITKVRGEIKVAIGVLQRNKEKVEEGKRMIENR